MERLEEALKGLKNFNLYEILEIEKTEDQDIIKKSYKKLIKKYHPDKNKDFNTVEKFDQIKLAFEILKNFELKALYDERLKGKEENKKKKNEMDSKRRKFMEDLEHKEKINEKKNKGEENTSKDFSFNSDCFKYKKYEEEFNKFFEENLLNKKNQKEENNKKTNIEDKLNKFGLKVILKINFLFNFQIKWRRDIDCIFTKETIKSYFKEFGTIEEIILLEKENKAMLIFTNDKALKAALTNQNSLLNKLFKMKKYSKKEIENTKKSTKFIKEKFINDENFEFLKKKRFMSNLNFMSKEEKSNNFFEGKAKENPEQEEDKSNSNEKIKGDLDFNLDLDNMEKLLFAKIRKGNL